MVHVDKKRKLELEFELESDDESDLDWNPDDLYKQDIASEIALEIGLRQRLLETVKSRIAWAQQLQECLMSDALNGAQTANFKEIALEALSAAEAPANILFAREEPPPPLPSAAKKARKKPTARAQLPKKTGKFLYIRFENNPTPSILRCPVCIRTDFSSLQGLFNHARGMHSLGWTSHDECVRQCACALEDMQGGPVDFSDLDTGIEVGVGTGGVLPGLRSIFHQAVGGDGLGLDGTTELNRTLGYHIDTPALANFLGRAPVRRGVTVWDPDAVVDVDGMEEESAKVRWRMPFSHRNVFKETKPPLSSSSPPEVAPPQLDSTNDGPQTGIPTSSSRFHMVTRIIVLDRSLWLPPEQRVGNDTHKWMISVDAPSYAHHITTILRSLTVVSPTESLGTTAPPFAVIGTANTSFLARLELSFNRTSADGELQKVILEHWVELDRMQSPSVAQGEEQIVDVGLDRRTVFLPAQSGYIAANTRVLWDMDLEKQRTTPLNVASNAGMLGDSLSDERKTRNALPRVKILGGWPTVLKKLVERFPLTLRDVKGGKPPSPALPYKLVATPAQFTSLVMGRKKAVEWGRAIALRDAYSNAVSEGLTEDVTTLTTADVFAWLHSNGYFPKAAATLKREQELQTLRSGLCHVCGLAYRLHGLDSDPSPAVKSEARASVGVGDTFVCQITPPESQMMKRLPIIDINLLFPHRTQGSLAATSAQGQKRSEVQTPDSKWDTRAPALLAVTDPNLIQAVRELVSGLRLPSFNLNAPASSTGLPNFPIDHTYSSAEIQAQVAPYAMLSLLIKPFIRGLVKTALEAAARDRQRAMGQVDGRLRRLPSIVELFTDQERMLTPSHIFRGIVTGWKDAVGMATLGCLVRNGVPLRLQQPQESSGTVPVSGIEVEKEPEAEATSIITYS